MADASSLDRFVHESTFQPLPAEYPIDSVKRTLLSTHAPPAASTCKFSMIDVCAQQDPLQFCHSHGLFKLMEQYTRTVLVTTPVETDEIMRLWTYRIYALLSLNLHTLAVTELTTLNVMDHPLVPVHLKCVCARFALPSPMHALQAISLLVGPDSGPDSIVHVYSYLVSIAAWDLTDPKLVDFFVEHVRLHLPNISVQLRASWWTHCCLAYLATLLVHKANWACTELESEFGPDFGLVLYVRACILSRTNQVNAANSAWSALHTRFSDTCNRLRAHEQRPDTHAISDRIPLDLFPMKTVPAVPETYAADLAWITPLVPILHIIANNVLVAQMFASGLVLESQWVRLLRSVQYNDRFMVGNFMAWIQVAPVDYIKTPGGGSLIHAPTSSCSVSHRKLDVVLDLIKVTDAGAVDAINKN